MQRHTYVTSKEMKTRATKNARRAKRMIGRRLQAKRMKMRMTHNQLSRRTGLSPRTLDQVELGKGKCDWRVLAVLALALEVELDEVLGG